MVLGGTRPWAISGRQGTPEPPGIQTLSGLGGCFADADPGNTALQVVLIPIDEGPEGAIADRFIPLPGWNRNRSPPSLPP